MLSALLDLLVPETCAGCGTLGVPLCAPCSAPLAAPPRPARPQPSPPGLPPVWTVADYEGCVRDALLAYKERGRRSLTAALATALVACVTAAGQSRSTAYDARHPLVLVPVPSRRAARRSRGADHLLGLARPAARQLTAAGIVACVVPLLRHTCTPVDSAGLTAAERAANLAGVLRAVDLQVPAGAVVVVDDVLTTGATLAEAGRALRAAGHDPVCAVIAATPRRRRPSV